MTNSHSEKNEYEAILVGNIIFARVKTSLIVSKTLQVPIGNKIFIEVPVRLYYFYPEQAPSAGMKISIIVRYYRCIGSGDMRWWVLITAWLYQLILSVILVGIFLPRFNYNYNIWLAQIPSPISLCYINLCKGTGRKLSQYRKPQ